MAFKFTIKVLKYISFETQFYVYNFLVNYNKVPRITVNATV